MRRRAIVNCMLKVGCALGLLCAIGCASVPAPYKPSQAGAFGQSDPDPLLSVRLETETPRISIGDLIVIVVRVRNISNRLVWLPHEPTIQLVWIYPDGERDSSIRPISQCASLSASDLMALAPGEELVRRIPIRTWYFGRPGIVEFRAMLHAPQNLNPRAPASWHGQLWSNRYGIEVLPPRVSRWKLRPRLPG